MHPVEFRLPAEWERQSALLLAWPFAGGDWSEVLEEIQTEYIGLITTILKHQPVVLLVQPGHQDACGKLGTLSGLRFIEVPCNDTWCRDYGPITLCHAGERLALDFHFNGWGGRYEARRDNRVNTLLARHELFAGIAFRQSLFELEGGAIESDGRGTLLINRYCMRARAPHLEDAEVDFELKSWLNIDHLMEVDVPPMPGDETDGHIDTLVRFAGPETILFQAQREDRATHELNSQLELLKNSAGQPFDLVMLPAPDDLDPGLAASYANFIIINDALIVPRFDSRADKRAAAILAEAFPSRTVEAVDARVLVSQGGGPHCASMQIPTNLQ